jgi:nucleotide-binding universal stress UspA family protein
VVAVALRIVVPLDGSALSEAVLPALKALLSAREASLLLLYAIPLATGWELGWDGMLPAPEDERQAREEAEGYLGGVAAGLGDADGVEVTWQLRQGDPARAIIGAARAFEADLIAMSTHGYRGVARLVMGSVAEEVVRMADVPVLLVRPERLRASQPLEADRAAGSPGASRDEAAPTRRRTHATGVSGGPEPGR